MIWKIYFYCKWVTFCESTFLQSLTFSCVVDIRYSAEFSKFRLHKITGTISRDTIAENFDFSSHDAVFFYTYLKITVAKIIYFEAKKYNKISKLVLTLLMPCPLQIPKCFVSLQIFWASPKIWLHLVPLQKLLCRQKNQFYWMQIIFMSGTKCLWLPQYVPYFRE